MTEDNHAGMLRGGDEEEGLLSSRGRAPDIHSYFSSNGVVRTASPNPSSFFLTNSGDGRDVLEGTALAHPETNRRSSVLQLPRTSSEDAAVRRTTRLSIFRAEDLEQNPKFAKSMVGFSGWLFQAFLILLTILMFSGGPILINYAHAVPGIRLNLSISSGQFFSDFLAVRGWAYQDTCDSFRIAKEGGCWSNARSYDGDISSGSERTYEGSFQHVINGDFTFFLLASDKVEAEISIQGKVYKPSEPIHLHFDGSEIFWTVKHHFPAGEAALSEFLEMRYLRGLVELSDRNVELSQMVKLRNPMEWTEFEDDSMDWKDVEMRMTKGNVYIESGIMFLMYSSAWVIGIVYIFFYDIVNKTKFKYSKMSWNFKMIWTFAPAAASWALADQSEAMSAGRMNPTVFMVLLQMRLILTVILAYFFLNRNPNKLQWGLLIALNCISMGFAIANSGSAGGVAFEWFPYIMTFAKIALSTGGTLYGEVSFHGDADAEPVPFMVQCNQICFVSVPISALGLLMTDLTPVPIAQYGFFGGVDFGWDWRTYCVVLMYLARNFVVNLCIKRFDATIKNICAASATMCVYVIGMLLSIEVFAMDKILSFIVLIVIVGLFFVAETWTPIIKGLEIDERKPEMEKTIANAASPNCLKSENSATSAYSSMKINTSTTDTTEFSVEKSQHL